MDPKALLQKIPKLKSLNISQILQTLPTLFRQGISKKIGSGSRHSGKSGTTLGCDFGRSKIVLLETEMKDDKIRILKFLQTNVNGDHAQSVEQLKKLVEAGGFASRKVRISVKGQGVITRFIQFPKMKPEEIRSAIQYEVEKYIPFKSTEVVVDYWVVDDNVKLASGIGMDLLLAAVKRDELYGLVKIFKQAGLDVELIDIDAIASINALEFFHPEVLQASVGIFDVGTEISNLCVVREGRPRFIRDISLGRADLVKLLQRKLGLSEDAARVQLDGGQNPSPEVLEVINQGLNTLMADLKVSMDYYSDQAQPSVPLQTLFVEGSGSYYPLLTKMLAQNLGIPVQPMDIMSKVELGPAVDADLVKKNRGSLPMAMGLSLREK